MKGGRVTPAVKRFLAGIFAKIVWTSLLKSTIITAIFAEEKRRIP
jgi:hypothetical protein